MDSWNESISLDQEKYLSDVLEKYGMASCKGLSTPAISGKIIGTDELDQPTNKGEYMSMVGSLIYLSVISLFERLDKSMEINL